MKPKVFIADFVDEALKKAWNETIKEQETYNYTDTWVGGKPLGA